MNQSNNLELSSVLDVVRANGLFVSLVTIRQPPAVLLPLNQVDLDPAAFTPVAGLENLRCMKSPLQYGIPREYERRRVNYIEESEHYHVLIDGYYPAIQQRQQALVDGLPYDILTVESDSQRVMTRLAIQEYAL